MAVVEQTARVGTARFRLLNLVRMRCLTGLDRGAREQLAALHADAVEILCRRHSYDVDRTESKPETIWLEALAEQLPDLIVALDWIIDRDPDRAIALLIEFAKSAVKVPDGCPSPKIFIAPRIVVGSLTVGVCARRLCFFLGQQSRIRFGLILVHEKLGQTAVRERVVPTVGQSCLQWPDQ